MTGCHTIGIVGRTRVVWKWRSPWDLPRGASMGGLMPGRGTQWRASGLMGPPAREWPDVRGTPDA